MRGAVESMEGAMMERHRYSVVILAYNQENFVVDAISAILQQDCQPCEILISDDASTDGTYEAIKSSVAGYAGPHRILTNRNAHNLGITSHLNRCFDLCQGELVIAAAGDDISKPGRIKRIIETYEKENPLLIHSRVDTAALNNGVRDRRFDKIGLLTASGLEELASSMSIYIGATAAWHRDLVDKYGYLPEQDCYEDLIFGFRAALEGRVSFIDEELVLYRVGEGASTKRGKGFSKEEWTRSRQKSLLRSLVVLAERLRNARTFGLAEDHSVVKAIKNSIAHNKARLNIHDRQGVTRGTPGLGHPLIWVRAVVAEALNYRNSRRRGI